MRQFLFAAAILFLYRLLSATWRKVVIQHPDVTALRAAEKTCVFAHWHGDEYAITHMVGSWNIATMVSTSRDGRIMDYVIRGLGGATTRGSSTRGGIAGLKGLVRLCRAGHNASIAVDGPRGPYHQVKPGVFRLARLTHAALVPVGVAARPSWVFEKTWNRAHLPLPFARVLVYMGAPLAPRPDSEDEQYSEDAQCAALGEAIDQAGAHAGELAAFTSGPAPQSDTSPRDRPGPTR